MLFSPLLAWPRFFVTHQVPPALRSCCERRERFPICLIRFFPTCPPVPGGFRGGMWGGEEPFQTDNRFLSLRLLNRTVLLYRSFILSRSGWKYLVAWYCVLRNLNFPLKWLKRAQLFCFILCGTSHTHKNTQKHTATHNNTHATFSVGPFASEER